jgi:hypothetical protein
VGGVRDDYGWVEEVRDGHGRGEPVRCDNRSDVSVNRTLSGDAGHPEASATAPRRASRTGKAHTVSGANTASRANATATLQGQPLEGVTWRSLPPFT